MKVFKNNFMFLVFYFVICWVWKAEGQTNTKIGNPVKNTVIQNGIVKHIDGTPYLFTVLVGTPAQILQYNIQTGKLMNSIPIGNTNNSWSIISEGDNIYIGGIDGILYRFNIKTLAVETLGSPIKGESVIFTLAKDENGNIYGGTYPNAGVFRYSPSSGFKILNQQRIDGNRYVRSLSYLNGSLFLGIGTVADLRRMSSSNYRISKIASTTNFKNFEFVYDQKIVNFNNQNLIIGTLSSNSNRKSFFYNPSNDQIEYDESFDVMSAIGVGSKLYYGQNGYIVERRTNGESVRLKKTGSSVLSSSKLKNIIYFLCKNNKLFSFNLNNNKFNEIQLEKASSGIKINFGFVDKSSNVWTAGYLAGGIARTDRAGKTTSFNGLDQAEVMLMKDQALFIGVYPQSRIYYFDINKPWKINQNPKLLGKVSGQDRPVSAALVKSLDKVYFGTIPAYGKVGGSLIEIDAKNNLKVIGQLIPGQSIISLVSLGDKIFGGSSVSGGIGGRPTAIESKLFEWDPRSSRLLKQFTIIPKSKSVSALTPLSTTQLCGMNDNYFFIYNTSKNEIEKKMEIIDAKSFKNPMRGSSIAIRSPTEIFVCIDNNLYLVNPNTNKIQIVKKNVDKVFGEKSSIYYSNSSSLFKY